MKTLNQYVAHVVSVEKVQSLDDHLMGTALFAEYFAAAFNCNYWGKILGEWHDLGKYSAHFQQYIQERTGLIEEEEQISKVDHSSAGALFAKEQLGVLGLPISYCIAGHHSGLLNWSNEIGVSGDMESRLQKNSLELIRKHLPPKESLNIKLLSPPTVFQPNSLNVWVRMLYSCLVDADYLDTERFMQPDVFKKRGGFISISEMKGLFDSYMEELVKPGEVSFINKKRTEVLIACRQAASLNNKHFNLTVPTGGGKTLSSLAFALNHAVQHKKERIIVVIPYTSIITQTAKIFKEIVGDFHVIEHHSNIDPEKLTTAQKQATENWDAPLIVTTNVQFFESLYACRSSRCRKLHNIVNSVVILDEAQMLPANFLKPITSILDTLMQSFGVTLLCTTATQPVLSGAIGSRKEIFKGIKTEAYNIVSDSTSLADDFKRVIIDIPQDLNEAIPFSDIAFEMEQLDQVLCIVNTRKESQDLFSQLPPDTLHLSRMMCSAHLLDTIEEIKQRLKDKLPIRVVSTQLIEAGVDIDFPVVYRAFSGLDSIAQAAGRCNREGKLNKKGKLGYVKVFVSEKGVPQGYMRKGADTLKELLLKNPQIDLLNPKTMTHYFDLLYQKLTNFDKADIKDKLWGQERVLKFQFASAAKEFKLIDDSGCMSFIVAYGDGVNYIDQLKKKGLETWILRKLQHYTVSVREQDFKELVKNEFIENIHGVWVQADANLYNSKSGASLANRWLDEVLITGYMN